MVVLNRIYTRTGDAGETALGTGERVSKAHWRIQAYGTVDETNSTLGIVRLHTTAPEMQKLDVQNDLFDLGGELCLPGMEVVKDVQVARLEALAEEFNADLPMLKEFILPGGTRPAALAHLSRTVCRRAERLIVELASHQGEHVSEGAVAYVNRLSDFFFVASRWANAKSGAGDVLWVPGKTR